ncbi:hypothetical protein B0H14DRAFT_3511820 [Mycena olivaceomarginata]|nr:hypothetical protein B0H14DRAFT_3511820 [Mycena olivaceomarginata]
MALFASGTSVPLFGRLTATHTKQTNIHASPPRAITFTLSAPLPSTLRVSTYRYDRLSLRICSCRCELRRKTAKAGLRAGQDYICCDDMSHPNEFCRWFPRSPIKLFYTSAAFKLSYHSQLLHLLYCPRLPPARKTLVQDHHASMAPVIASFLDALSAAVNTFTPRPSTLIMQATTDEQKLCVTHPHWFSSPTPSPAHPSSLPITFTLVDFAYNQKPAIVRAMHSSNWDWVRPGDRPYDTYSADFNCWMPVEAAYSHNLRHHQRILIRSRGVIDSNEDVHIATLVGEVQVYENELPFVAHTPPPPRPLHLPASPSQHRLASSSSSVSLGMVEKGKKQKIEEELSDNEIIVTGYKAPIPSRRPRLTVHIPSSSTSLPTLSLSSPGPSTLSTAGLSTPSFPPLDSSPTFPSSIPLPPRRTQWKF